MTARTATTLVPHPLPGYKSVRRRGDPPVPVRTVPPAPPRTSLPHGGSPMPRFPVRALMLAAFGLAGLCLTPAARADTDLVQAKWVPSTAYAVPKETAPEGEGYFSIIEGHNGRLYIGTHANGLNAWLVEFDPKTKKMIPVVDVMKEIGSKAKGFAAQAKIHTRNNVGDSGKVY